MVAWLSDPITTGERGLDFSKEKRWRVRVDPLSLLHTLCVQCLGQGGIGGSVSPQS